MPKDKDEEAVIGIDVLDVFENKLIGGFSQSRKGSEKGHVFSIFEDRELVPILQADKVNPIVEQNKFEALINHIWKSKESEMTEKFVGGDLNEILIC